MDAINKNNVSLTISDVDIGNIRVSIDNKINITKSIQSNDIHEHVIKNNLQLGNIKIHTDIETNPIYDIEIFSKQIMLKSPLTLKETSKIIHMKKTLVLYVFHEFNERVDMFIKNAIFYDENTDFIVISNNKYNKFEVPNYVKKLYRDNIGFDFGGWSEAILTDKLYNKYDYFIFVNSSVIGPFIPSYYTGKWTDIYINGLNDNVKLFGSTINTILDPINKSHIQTFIFSMDKNTLKYLIDCEIFSMKKQYESFSDTIKYKEIGMSRKIIENGWNIGSLLPHYKNVDFTFKTKKPSDYNITFFGDFMFPDYCNKYWEKNELVFIKGNRKVSIYYTKNNGNDKNNGNGNDKNKKPVNQVIKKNIFTSIYK